MQTFRSDADYYKTTLSKCLCRTSPREYIVQEDCPRVSILPGLDEGKSRSRSCQRTAQGAPQRLLLCGIVGRESLYRTTVMGTLTHTGWSKATWSGPRRFRYKTSRDLLKLSIFVVNGARTCICRDIRKYVHGRGSYMPPPSPGPNRVNQILLKYSLSHLLHSYLIPRWLQKLHK